MGKVTNIIDYAKRLGVEVPGTTETPLDKEAGKAGYDKYLADLEAKAKAEKEAQDNETFFEKIGRYLGGTGAQDTSLSLNQGMNQAVEAYKNNTFNMRPNDDWTDEERWAFGEKYANNEYEAYAFAEKLNSSKAQEKKRKQQEAIEKWSKKNIVNRDLASLASVGLNATLGSVGYLDALAQRAAGRDTINQDVLLPHEIANTMQGAVAQYKNEKYGTISEKIPIIGGKGLGDLYGVKMSILQSALSGATGGSANTLVQFFGMSASQGVSDALARGASADQALAFGTISGLAEAIPEMISMDSLLGIASSEGVQTLFRSVLKQAGEEAREELTTSLITEVADRWIMGGKSNYQLMVNELVASGMSVQDAQKKAFAETVEGIAYDTLSGALSGGISGAGAYGFNRVNQQFFQKEKNATAKALLTPEQNTLIEKAKKYDTTKKRASALEKKLAEGKELTGFELRRLSSEISEASRTADVETTRKAIVDQMKSEGLSDSDAKKLGEIALNKAIGNDVSKVQDLMLKRNEKATMVYNQISEARMKDNLGAEWAKNTPIERLRAEKQAVKENSEIKVENKPKTGLDQLKEDLAKKYGLDTKEYKLNMDSVKDKIEVIDGGLAYKKSSADSKIHTEGITSALTHEDIVELSAIEKIANELGVDIYVYESKVDKKTGDRVYTDKEGNRYSDSGFYDTNRNTIHIDLRAGMNGEGTMLYTASHEVVHFIKKNAPTQYEALEKLVTEELIKGGFTIDQLVDIQKDVLKKNGWDGTEKNFDEVAREEMVAEACQSFLASKNAVAQIQALKTENKGLWSALKRFFTSLFTKINKIYKTVPPDSAEGKYLAEMKNSVKKIRDAFMEGAVAASKNAAQNKENFEKNYQKSKDIRHNARYYKEHRAALEKLGDASTTVPMEQLLGKYDKLMEIWDTLGGELNSEFLKQWNDKSGKDRAFTVFKAQAGYKYNVELSSMCKKGIPLFEAIDTIVRGEVVNQLNNKTIGKAEKEILYELLKEKHFEIPCAICYVEQARQREGEIINAFLDGKIEKTPSGKTKTYKIGWNETFDALEKGMKSQGVNYTFSEVSRDIATDKYTKADTPSMDARTEKAFYSTLLKLVNKEIARYNEEKDPKAKARMPLTSITPSEIKRCLSGTLSANLKLYKTIATNPDSRFRINNDLLYSSATTTNLASFHNDLYSLFNMQGGVSGYKSKQGTVVYWGDILSKKWDSSKLRKEGGVRNQSNSDFMMYTLLDQAQMYMDFTAKGYYLQAYTKVIAELKLFGLSRGKINASLIPSVVVYRKDNGFEVDIERTRENAGLDENGNPIYDDIEGVPHEEAFMLIEDAEYSKSIGGICIGYSDNHIRKLLADNRIQLIIGYHDKTDDPDKRYRGARYAKNYNGENEARVRNSDGTFTTKHVGFNQFVMSAEKLFKRDTTSVEYNGKNYKYDDIPKLAADMYLKMCEEKSYIPAYDQFSNDKNYYKLLADFSLYDSEGHYAPHQKVAYNMPDVVPFLDDNGNKQYMPTRDYIKKELKKELTVRDDISAALSDHTENGIIPKFVKQANQLYESQNIRHKARDSAGNELTLQQQEYFKDSAVRDMKGNLLVLYHGTTADFNTFKKGDVGFHFGTKGAARGRVGYGKNVNLKEVYLNITNPIVFEEDLGSWDADFRLTRELYERGVLTWEEAETVLLTDNKQYRRTTEAANKKLASALQSKGYDGISYTNTFESKTPTTSYIIFDSNQAKLITNTEPTLDKDIRHKVRKAEENYNKATVNTEILTLVSNVSNGSFAQQDKVYFGAVSNDIAKQIKSITGIDVTGYRMAIEARQISHILKDHGKLGIADHSMSNNNDIAKMEYTMRSPDEISYGGKTKAYSTVRNGKTKTADTILYEKVIGEKSYYVVQATPDTKAKTLYVVTAFIGKSGYKNKMEAPQLANVNNLGVTSEIGSAVASNNSISQSTEDVNTKSEIRHKSRSTVTSGQYEQMKANLSHSKVYSKKSAMELVKRIAPGIRNRSFETLSNQLWEGLNSYTNTEDRRQFAKDMSEMFIDRMLVDTLVKHSEWDAAVEKMAYLKAGIGCISFREEDIPDLKYKLDKKFPSLRSRWGYKKPSDGSFKRAYGLDEFITDLSREMPGMHILAEMHPAEALIEVDALYSDLQEQIKEKYESAYNEFSDEEIKEIQQGIEYEIMHAYTELGDKTKIAKYLEEKFDYYQSRIDYWKAENAKTKKVTRWHNIISTKALQIKDLKKGAYYNATQHHQDIFKNSIETLANIQWRANLKPTQKISEIFENLKQWYTMQNPMLYNKDSDLNVYSDTIATYITKIADSKGAFDDNTYGMVYDVMNHLYTLMRNYNKVFKDGRWQDAPSLVEDYIKVMEENKRKRNAVTRLKDTYVTEFLEPMAIAKRVDNYNEDGFFTQTMQDLRQSAINASVGEMKLRKKYDNFIDANKKYLMNAAKETVKYRGVEIPKIHLIGLYMTMKREHARAGLALNGFEFTVKNKWWDSADKVYVPGYVVDEGDVTQEMINTATMEQMKIIEKEFTATDKEYISILESLFNEDLRALKIERDMERQGYTNATLDYYYPIIRGAMAENIDTSKFSDQNRATNSSFNKNTVKGAKQRLVIISADAMVNRHITDMCKYYYMSQAIENYNVLYNCDISGNPNNPMNIAKIVSEGKIWEKDVAYFRQLVKDMQGIRDPRTAWENAFESLRGNYAKFALGINVKVLATQFSSVIAAGNVIGFKSLATLKGFKTSTADIEKYCPIAAVRSYDKTALKAMSVTDKIDKTTEKFTALISVVDDFVIRKLFGSCQVEAQKRGLGELGTEENKFAAGKILEQVILETQQNSYATERSQAMRSRNEILKSLTMFTADGMKLISRIHEAVGEFKAAKASSDASKIKAARKKVARSFATSISVAVYMASIAVLFNWILAKDEDEDEDKLLAFGLDVLGNTISALPLISEFYELLVNGFEVESVVFDTINNVAKGVSNVTKDMHNLVFNPENVTSEQLNRDLRTLLYGVGQMSGIPVRNVYNLGRGILDKFSSKATYYLDSKFYETSLKSDLEKAIKENDSSKADYIISLLYDDRIETDVSKAQREEILSLTKNNYNVLPKTIPDEIKRDGRTYTLTSNQKDIIIKEYSKVNAAIDKLISTSFYSTRKNADKAYLIDYYHDKYYEIAVNKALKLSNDKVTLYNTIGFSTYAQLDYLTRGIESDKDKDGNAISGSKKEKVIEAVNKTKAPEGKRLLYIASLGYKLSEEDEKKLCKYLNSLSISSSNKKKLAEICGLAYKNGKITSKK